MRTYADGDIINEIKTSLLKSDHVTNQFSLLFDESSPLCDTISGDDQPEILSYILDRYANMRGTYFTNCLKRNCNKSSTDDLAERKSTRDKVATAVISAKVAGESKERDLWIDAGVNVLEREDALSK